MSIALNKRETNRVSAETRAKIHRVAEEMNYVPNELARALAESRTRLLGLVVPMRDPIFFNLFIAQALSGIQHTLMQRGYNLLVYSSMGKSGLVSRDKIYESKYTDGIIFVNTRSCSTETVQRTIRELQAAKLKFAMINSYYGNASINYVGVDDAAIGAQAVEYLVERGHRRIALMSGSPTLPAHTQLTNGMRRALEGHSLSLPDGLVGCTDYDRSRAFRLLDRWFSRKSTRPSAIVTADDQLLMHLYDYVEEKGLVIPDDVAVLARRNTNMEDHVRPKPTAIAIPTFKMGELAAELLINSIEQKDFRAKRVLLPFDFIPGATS